MKADHLFGAEGWRKLTVQQGEAQLMETIFNDFEKKGWPDVACPLPLWFNARAPLKVLDFGCGLARTLEWLRRNTSWDLTGYDTPEMIARVKTLAGLGEIRWSDDWDTLKEDRFHVIHASLVMQHLHPAALSRYIRDLSAMTHFLVLRGRDWLDVGRGNVHATIWPMLQEEGFAFQEIEKSGDHGTFVYLRKGTQ